MELKRVRLDSINFGHRFRKDYGDIDSLARSINEHGLLQPPVVTDHSKHGYLLIAGGRRLRAVQKLGWSMVHVRVLDVPDRLQQIFKERDENDEAKPFTPSERVALGKEVERLLGERRGRPSSNGEIPAESAGISGKESREVAAETAGFTSTTQYRNAKEVVEHGSVEIIAAMDAGEIKVSAAAKHVKELRAAIKERTKKKGGTGKGGSKKKEQLLPYPDDDKIDRILEEAVAALESRAKAFGITPELKSIIDDQDAVLARWHEFAGKPAPEQEIIPDELDTDEFRKVWAEWKAYRKEIKDRLSPTTRRRQLKELEGWGLEAAIKSMETSMTKGWHGLFPPDKEKPKSGGRAGIKAALGK